MQSTRYSILNCYPPDTLPILMRYQCTTVRCPEDTQALIFPNLYVCSLRHRHCCSLSPLLLSLATVVSLYPLLSPSLSCNPFFSSLLIRRACRGITLAHTLGGLHLALGSPFFELPNACRCCLRPLAIWIARPRFSGSFRPARALAVVTLSISTSFKPSLRCFWASGGVF